MFVALMKKPSKTILIDQDPWMIEATAKELPSTKHTFSIWHILLNLLAGSLSLFTLNIQNSVLIFICCIGWRHLKNLNVNGLKLLESINYTITNMSLVCIGLKSFGF